MIVLDASAALAVLLNSPSAARIAARLFVPGETLHAPHLLDLEVAQVLRRYFLKGEMDSVRAGEAFNDFADFPLTRYSHAFLLPRVWMLRDNCTAYDAAYIALSEVLDATLVTCDAALASAGWHGAAVEVFA